MAKPKLEFGEHQYQLVVGDEESGLVDYGEPIEFRGYIAFMDSAEESGLSAMLFRASPLADSEIDTEDVEFEGDDEEGEGVVEVGAE